MRSRESYISILLLLHPERYEELIKQIDKNVKENYSKIYKPIVDAIRNHGPLTPKQISQITEISARNVKKYLDRLNSAKLIEKEGNAYTITDENLRSIMNVFGRI